jgi:hypothetical protein
VAITLATKFRHKVHLSMLAIVTLDFAVRHVSIADFSLLLLALLIELEEIYSEHPNGGKR